MSRQSPARQVRKAQRRKQTRAQQQTNALALSKQLRAQLVAHFQRLHAGKTDHREYAAKIHALALACDVELIQEHFAARRKIEAEANEEGAAVAANQERAEGPRTAQDAPAGADEPPSTTEAPGGAQGAPGEAQEGSAALARAGFGEGR